jgi:hypothetical protein
MTSELKGSVGILFLGGATLQRCDSGDPPTEPVLNGRGFQPRRRVPHQWNAALAAEVPTFALRAHSQGLKPAHFAVPNGAAEAAPLQSRPFIRSSSSHA